MLKKFIHQSQIFKLYKPYLPQDHSRTITADYYPKLYLQHTAGPLNVLDLGCGAGNSVDLFEKTRPDISWFGVDIEDSPEAATRQRFDGNFSTYDGINLPYEDSFFDFIYATHVFEHVRYPDQLLQNVYRVLRPGGSFTGSVSYLEPYHSRSLFNFTPYGVLTSFADAGFTLQEMRPGTDAPALILRQMLNAPPWFTALIRKGTPFKVLIALLGTLFDLSHRERNFLKLHFAGHICFMALKPSAAG